LLKQESLGTFMTYCHRNVSRTNEKNGKNPPGDSTAVFSYRGVGDSRRSSVRPSRREWGAMIARYLLERRRSRRFPAPATTWSVHILRTNREGVDIWQRNIR